MKPGEDDDGDDDNGPAIPRRVTLTVPPRSDSDRIIDAMHAVEAELRRGRELNEHGLEVQKKQLHWTRVTGTVVWIAFTLFMLFGVKIVFLG